MIETLKTRIQREIDDIRNLCESHYLLTGSLVPDEYTMSRLTMDQKIWWDRKAKEIKNENDYVDSIFDKKIGEQ